MTHMEGTNNRKGPQGNPRYARIDLRSHRNEKKQNE